MGLFDFIKNVVKDLDENIEAAQKEAKRLSMNELVNSIQNDYSPTKLVGYREVLLDRCNQMSDSELKMFFNKLYYQKKAKVCNMMMPVMEGRGLAYKDDEGRIHKTY